VVAPVVKRAAKNQFNLLLIIAPLFFSCWGGYTGP
jgi:hypothetical protein